MAEEVDGRVVCEEGCSGVGEHPDEGGGEAAVEIGEAGAWGWWCRALWEKRRR